MNTGLRRFILRVAVGLLAFLLGVAVAWALGGLNPFQSSSGEGSYSYHEHCNHSRSMTSTSSDSNVVTYETETLYESGRTCKTKRTFVLKPLPPPPPPVAPDPPGGS